LAHQSEGFGCPGDSVNPVSGFLSWWDGNELWLSGLPFVLQAMVVMPVVLVVAYLTASVLDRVLGKGIELLHREHDDHRAGGAPG
jgi:membrane protein implicated in regulation of membrane protease activity